ncbi:PocR ligand-binding domain-containing protein [Heyndrickxia sp. FSL W8-0423]|uniref:PocR ligand-binding domain-containing protein n=1 Tax=Heyndrickxia sp. FSL W8-0423 TaxID=2921601 RepID=UPI0030F9F828
MEINVADLQYICELIYKAHNISVYNVNQFGEFEYEFSRSDLRENPYYAPFMEQISVYTYEDDPNDFPIFFTNSNLNFFFINLKKSNLFIGTIIVGPVLESKISGETITKIMDAFKGEVNKRQLIEYYQSVPIMDKQQLLTISLLMYYLIYRKKLDETFVVQNNQDLTPDLIEVADLDLELSKGRRNFLFHSNLSYERVLLDYVKNGLFNTSALRCMGRKVFPFQLYSVHSNMD